MRTAGVIEFSRGIKGSLVCAAFLLILDGVLSGACLFSWLVCPIWFLISVVKTRVDPPGWGLPLARIGAPVLTFGLVWANAAFQGEVAESNARRVIAACEAYHAANGNYPKKLVELVPQYMNSVPPAKHCLGPSSQFGYHNNGSPLLYWHIVGLLRRIYSFVDRRWSYLD